MLAFKVQWHDDVRADLSHLDNVTAKEIITRVSTYLVNDPVKLGKALAGQFTGLYRYRYGDYRVLYALDLEQEMIMVLHIRHRKDIYQDGRN